MHFFSIENGYINITTKILGGVNNFTPLEI